MSYTTSRELRGPLGDLDGRIQPTGRAGAAAPPQTYPRSGVGRIAFPEGLGKRTERTRREGRIKEKQHEKLQVESNTLRDAVGVFFR